VLLLAILYIVEFAEVATHGFAMSLAYMLEL
jgi:hypothetical protein